MKCEYCGKQDLETDAKHCPHCGGAVEKPVQHDDRDRRVEPVFFNGYIVYRLEDRYRNTVEFQFWLGKELQERLLFSKELLEAAYMPMGTFSEDDDPVWQLFLVAQGKQEAYIWKEKNTRYPATFIVTRVENAEREQWRSFSTQDKQALLQLVRR